MNRSTTSDNMAYMRRTEDFIEAKKSCGTWFSTVGGAKHIAAPRLGRRACRNVK